MLEFLDGEVAGCLRIEVNLDCSVLNIGFLQVVASERKVVGPYKLERICRFWISQIVAVEGVTLGAGFTAVIHFIPTNRPVTVGFRQLNTG